MKLLAVLVAVSLVGCGDSNSGAPADKGANGKGTGGSSAASNGGNGDSGTDGADGGAGDAGAGGGGANVRPAVDDGGTSEHSDLVATESFENGFSAEDWQVDNVQGAHDGPLAVHPPALKAGDEKSMTFDCNGESHTQLRFWLSQRTGGSNSQVNGTPIEQLGLDLSVDDDSEPRESFGGTHSLNDGGWYQYIIDVPSGSHKYTFTVHSDSDIAPPFVLDLFECVSKKPSAGVNNRVSFDDGFIPIETSGDWLVDNTRGVQGNGEAAIHPPHLKAGDEKSMRFDCNGESHTQLNFWLSQRIGGSNSGGNGTPIEQLGLDLFVDDDSEPRESFGGTSSLNDGGWYQYMIDVPSGSHKYTFTVHSDSDIAPPFVLDSFGCSSTKSSASVNGRVSFDDGFIPIETSGDWLVDNTQGAHDGDVGIHPPHLKADDEKSMRFDCNGESHTQLNFWLSQRIGGSNSGGNGTPIEQLGPDLFVDDDSEPRESFGGTSSLNDGGWYQYMIDVPSGSHKYTFTVHSDSDIAPPFVLDSFECM